MSEPCAINGCCGNPWVCCNCDGQIPFDEDHKVKWDTDGDCYCLECYEPSEVEDYGGQAYSPNDYSDDAEALASAGFGTDEDYGGGDDRL